LFRNLKAKIPVHVAHANKIRYFAKASGELAKTDTIDAKIICLYAQHFNLRAKAINITPEQEYLKGLAVRRNQLLSEKVREQNRLEIPLPDCLMNSIKKHINWLEQELEQIELLIDKYISSSQELTKHLELMTSIPGIGKQTAIAFITDVPELGNIDTPALSALIGVAPFASDSGTIKKQRRIYGGRTNVRQVLYMATVASLRVNHLIKSFYTKLIKKGKKAKVAIVACMHKLLSILNSVAKRQSVWVNS
jgi:transposase